MAGIPYRLDYQVVIDMAHGMEIETDELFFGKLSAFENEVLAIWDSQRDKDKCDAKQRARCKAEHGNFIEWACANCEKGTKKVNG